MSRARRECQDRLSALTVVAKAATKTLRLSSESQIRQAALQGVVVQMHSALEEYVTSLVSDWVREMITQALTVSSVSDQTRSWLFHQQNLEAYRHYAYSLNERKLVEAAGIRRLDRTLLDDNAQLPPHIDSEVVIGKRKYPSLDNLKALFVRIGFNDLKQFLDQKLQFNSELFMRSISDTRAAVTHKRADPLTKSDVDCIFQENREGLNLA